MPQLILDLFGLKLRKLGFSNECFAVYYSRVNGTNLVMKCTERTDCCLALWNCEAIMFTAMLFSVFKTNRIFCCLHCNVFLFSCKFVKTKTLWGESGSKIAQCGAAKLFEAKKVSRLPYFDY